MDLRAMGGFRELQSFTDFAVSKSAPKTEAPQNLPTENVTLTSSTGEGLTSLKDMQARMAGSSPAPEVIAEKPAVSTEAPTVNVEKEKPRNPGVLSMGVEDVPYDFGFGLGNHDFAFGPNNLGSLTGVLNNVEFTKPAAPGVNWGAGGTLTQGLE